MATEVETLDKHQIDKDKKENLDFLFNSEALPQRYKLLSDDDAKIDPNEIKNEELSNKPKHKLSFEEIIQNRIKNGRENNLNPELILNNKINAHNKYNNVISNVHNPHNPDEHVHLKSQSFLFILLTVIICQFAIYFWKKKHNKSFFMITLLGLWLFPFFMSISLLYYRMIFIWLIVSIIMIILLNQSRKRPMNRKTPRYLYSWFYFLYKLTNILSIIGYILFLADFFGFGLLIFGPHPSEEREYRSKLLHHQHEQHVHQINHDDPDIYSKSMEIEKGEIEQLSHSYSHIHFSDIGIYLLFYGLYFGVLSRDTAQLCAEWISSALGFFNPSGFPRRRVPINICAVCNNPLIIHDIFSDHNNDNETIINDNDTSTERRMKLMMQRRNNDKLKELEDNIKKTKFKNNFNPLNWFSLNKTKQDEEIAINCGHRFHGFCIRGWIMIGKRDVCPVCKEKVNLKGIFANPWQKQDRMWSQLLDGVRYLLVWNPVIVLCANLVFTATGMSFTEKGHHHQQMK